MDLSKFPRRIYTPNDTPLEAMPRLSRAVGGNVNLWIKRDDKLGLAGGGNKTRKLEFTIAEALEQGADTIITCGAVQSNHCRLTLAACKKEGLACCLVLEERVPKSYDPNASGNNYLYRLLGVDRVVTVGLGESPAGMQALAKQLRAQGRNVYIVPGGASNVVGATGYASCAEEITHQQYRHQLPRFDAVVTASGSGGTHAGLVTGFSALRNPTHVIGISTRGPKAKQEAKIRGLSDRLAEHLDVAKAPAGAVEVFDGYVGAGYSLPTDGMKEAVAMFARLEGVLLDPVYSGKAAAGLLDLVRKGHFPDGSNVLFLHTGGAPTLFHYKPLPDGSTVWEGAASRL